MNIILLSGGSGKRLWPLSNDIRSKQFLKIFRQPDGSYESMAQRMYRQIRKIDADAKVTVATGKSQVSEIRNQLGPEVGISVEPCRRDTFPAIALACAYLHDLQHVGEDEPVVVCPVDPYVEDDYFEALKKLSALAAQGSRTSEGYTSENDTSDGEVTWEYTAGITATEDDITKNGTHTDPEPEDGRSRMDGASEANLTLMGIEPTYPSEKYGYIIPESRGEVARVSTFKEKPDLETAKQYLQQGALWNGGIFAFRLGYVLEKAHALLHFTDYQDLSRHYEDCPKISFDYAVVEKEPHIQVLRFHGLWKDLGTWNTLTEAMSDQTIGRVQMDESSENTHVINDLDIPVLVMGVKNAVIAAAPDGILVSDKEQSSYIKPYVDRMEQPVMFAEKSWGSYQVLDVENDSMTIKVTLLPGHHMNYHSHDHRDEVWTVISGNGRTIVDGMEQRVHAGDVITMQAGCRHTVIADTELQLIEVQLGEDISAADKHKYKLEGFTGI